MLLQDALEHTIAGQEERRLVSDQCSAGPSPASGLGLSHVPCSHSPSHTSFQVSECFPCAGLPLLRPGAGTAGVGIDILSCIKPSSAKLEMRQLCNLHEQI